MREMLGPNPPGAVLFDLDGTLYHQAPVRRTMMARLARHHATRPAAGYRALRILSEYRRAQEDLRRGGFSGDIAAEQVAVAAIRASCETDAVRTLVERWMEIGPLDAIARHPRIDVVEFVKELHERRIPLGVVSDYPAERKLAALGLTDRFSLALSAQDERVGAFKPDPKGLLVALADLGVEPEHAWYVGDRLDVDQPAALAAEMSFAAVGRSARPRRIRPKAPER